MRPASSLVVSVVGLPALVAAFGSHAHAVRANQLQQRQAPPPSGSSPASTPALLAPSSSPPPAAPPPSTNSAPGTPATPGTAPPTGPSTVSPTASGPPVVGGSSVTSAPVIVTPTTIYSFSLVSTNPTAVPLSQIVSNAVSSATRPLDTTVTPGSVPTFLPGAPPLPNPATLVPASYPPLDRIPPTDSPEVQQWIAEVQKTGIQIPDIPQNLPGGCPANLQAAQDPNRCWWTCTGCTRPSDVTDCPAPMQWGLTYDDGPAFYTSNLLNYLDQEKLKSTFFVVGSRVISFPNILQTQYMGQHQIAVHTWSHPTLTTLSNNEIIAELGWSKKVIKDVLGVTPNMMRPPFGDIDDRVRAISIAMGLTPVIWTRINQTQTFDTDDFNIHSGITPVGKVLQNWELILSNATQRKNGFIVLEHDLFQESVEVATGYILPDGIAHKFTIQPVITCLNKPLTDAYIELNDNRTNPPPAQQSAVVTLSSGAPGSVQATGKPNSGTAGTPMPFGTTLSLAVATTLTGALASFALLV